MCYCKAREHNDENDGVDNAGVVLVKLVGCCASSVGACHDLSSRLVDTTLLASEVGSAVIEAKNGMALLIFQNENRLSLDSLDCGIPVG